MSRFSLDLTSRDVRSDLRSARATTCARAPKLSKGRCGGLIKLLALSSAMAWRLCPSMWTNSTCHLHTDLNRQTSNRSVSVVKTSNPLLVPWSGLEPVTTRTNGVPDRAGLPSLTMFGGRVRFSSWNARALFHQSKPERRAAKIGLVRSALHRLDLLV